MKIALHASRRALIIAAIALGAGAGTASATDVPVSLSGANEVPPVMTSASGSGTLVINPDMSVSGKVTTSGVDGTMAHIHEAAAGKNGPVVVPLEKQGDGGWAVPAGAKLNDAQFRAFQNGNLYVNVHSAAHPGGEIRAQLKP